MNDDRWHCSTSFVLKSECVYISEIHFIEYGKLHHETNTSGSHGSENVIIAIKILKFKLVSGILIFS